jgi:hypothetical protein
VDILSNVTQTKGLGVPDIGWGQNSYKKNLKSGIFVSDVAMFLQNISTIKNCSLMITFWNS